jgi:hypothetical protein
MMDVRRPVRAAIIGAGAAAVIVGGGVLALQQTGSKPAGHATSDVVNGQRVDLDTGTCDAVHQQLEKKQKVNGGDARQCDQQEFAELERKRLSSSTPLHAQLSVTCALVDNRLAGGDITVPEDLATNCRNRELFAIKTDADHKLGSPDKPTAMCQGKRHLDDDGGTAPDFWDDACSNREFGTKPLPVPETAEPDGGSSPTPPESGDDTAPGNGTTPQIGSVTTCDATPISGQFEHSGVNTPLQSAGSTLFPVGARIRVDDPDTEQFVEVVIGENADRGCLSLSETLRSKLATPLGASPVANVPPVLHNMKVSLLDLPRP